MQTHQILRGETRTRDVPVPMSGLQVSSAITRLAGRYLERNALQARLDARAGAEAVPVLEFDTFVAMKALALSQVAGIRPDSLDGQGRAVRRMLTRIDGGLTLAVDVVPAAILFNAGDLARLIGELVSNAARHAPAGSTVRVRGAPGEGGYLISVTNTGDAMPRWALASMRLDSGEVASRDPRGIALGLPIAAALAAVNQARLQALRAAGRPNTLRVIARQA